MAIALGGCGPKASPQLTYQDTHAVRSYMIDNYSPAYARKVIAAMKGALRMSWRLGSVPSERRDSR